MIFLDTETTGLLKPEENELINQPHIIEFYGVRLDWDGDGFRYVSEFETFVRPPVPIEPIITNITGIDDRMVANAPTFPQIYKDLCQFFMGEDTLVAHNAPFDVGVIYCELARIEKQIQFPWPMNHQCTVELSFHIENKRLKLKKLHEMATGLEHEDQHRASGDVKAMVKCYEWLINEGHVKI